MKNIVEYGTFTDQERSKKSVLGELHQYRLLHISAGYEPAGACARWTDEEYAVNFDLDGAIHGRRFAADNRQQAIQLFEQWTAERYPGEEPTYFFPFVLT